MASRSQVIFLFVVSMSGVLASLESKRARLVGPMVFNVENVGAVAHQSLNTLMKASKGIACENEVGSVQKELCAQLDNLSDLCTPYGKVVESFELLEGERDSMISCCNPFAWLWHLCGQSHHFARFVAYYLNGITSHIAFYTDDTEPGNVLRPDDGRKFLCTYWTFFELPEWWRCRSSGWLPFCFVPLQMRKIFGVHEASILRITLLRFFSPDGFNFSRTGVRLPCGDSHFYIRSELGCFIMDEAAIKHTFNVKGASGSKPCLWCQNVVGRTETIRHDYLVSVKSAASEKFIPHSDVSFKKMVDEVVVAKGVSKAKLNEIEQICGLVYDPAAIWLDAHVMSFVRVPHHIFWDWMHCLVASGGVVQYLINEFCNILVNVKVRNPFTLAQLDHFASKVCWPKGQKYKFPKLFFQKRIKLAAGKHVRAFAIEVLQVMQVLQLFVQVVLGPAGILLKEVACLKEMFTILQILQLGDACKQHLDVLGTAIRKHHELFLELWPDAAKPKLHYLVHVRTCIQRFGVNLSCFAMERRHSGIKQKAEHFCTSGSIARGLLRRVLASDLGHFRLAASFEKVHLVAPTDVAGMDCLFKGLGFEGIVEVSVSTVIVASIGRVCAGDLVCHRGEHARCNVGFLMFAARVVFSARPSSPVFFLCIDVLPQLDHSDWSAQGGQKHFVQCDLMTCMLPYAREGNTITPIFSAYD